MLNCVIKEFRFRPNWIINLSNGGKAILTNVDFENVEPGKYSHEKANEIEDFDNQPRGIITAF